jgi:hypothetical protein
MKNLLVMLFVSSLSVSVSAQQHTSEMKRLNPGVATGGGMGGIGAQGVWTCQMSSCKNIKNTEGHNWLSAITPTQDQAAADKICKEKFEALDDQTINSYSAYGSIMGMWGTLPSKTENNIWLQSAIKTSAEFHKRCSLTGKMSSEVIGKSVTNQKGLEIPMRACEMVCEVPQGGNVQAQKALMSLYAISESDVDAIELCKEKLGQLQSGKVSVKQLKKQNQLIMATGIGMNGAGGLMKSEMRFLRKKLKHLYDGCTVKAVPGQMGMNMGEMKF